MGFLDIFRRNRKSADKEDRTYGSADFSYGSFSITSFFGDGKGVTEDQAMSVPAVAASVELITSSIAQLPIYLYKENEKGEVEKVPDRRIFLLNEEPNDLMNGHNYKKQMVKDYLFHGASYTKIEKVRNDVTSLYTLPTEDVSVTKYVKDGYKYSAIVNLNYVNGSSSLITSFNPEDLVVVLKDSDDGIIGKGVLSANGDVLKLAIDEQTYTKNIFKNGALPIGVLKAATRLTEPVINRLRASWESLYAGAAKSGKTIILEEGLDYKPISMNPAELDLGNSRKNTVSEIARIFNIPESMINASLNKYTNNDQNNLYYLQYCIGPIITAIESGLNKALLLESEKEQGYYFRFDTSEILRTTEKDKVETAVAGMKGGLYSINEARAMMDKKALDTDYFTWTLGNIFFDPKKSQMIIPNLGKVIDVKNPEAMMAQNPAVNGQNNDPNVQNNDQNVQNEGQNNQNNDQNSVQNDPNLNKNESKNTQNKPKNSKNKPKNPQKGGANQS